MSGAAIVTLTTDFGTRQGSQAVLHGVIAGICPEATVTDLTHEVTPFDSDSSAASCTWRRASSSSCAGVIDLRHCARARWINPDAVSRKMPIGCPVGSFRISPPGGFGVSLP